MDNATPCRGKDRVEEEAKRNTEARAGRDAAMKENQVVDQEAKRNTNTRAERNTNVAAENVVLQRVLPPPPPPLLPSPPLLLSCPPRCHLNLPLHRSPPLPSLWKVVVVVVLMSPLDTRMMLNSYHSTKHHTKITYRCLYMYSKGLFASYVYLSKLFTKKTFFHYLMQDKIKN